MLAIDTNVVVRFLTADHPEQSARAKRLIEEADVFVATTVLLETEWVLRSAYGFTRRQVVHGLRAFAGLPRVTLQDPALAATALAQAEQGVDFADALHLGAALNCEAFLTYDRRLAAAAKRHADIEIRVPQ